MSRSSGIRLRIEPGYSRLLAGFVTITHLLTLLVVLALPISVLAICLLALLVTLSFVQIYRVQVLRKGRCALLAAELDSRGEWTLFTRGGPLTDVRLHYTSFVQPRLTILTFKTGRWVSRSLVLPPDAVDQDTLRRLRVRIRTG